MASLQDDLADALARYQASAAREREMFAKLFEVKQQLHHEKWLSASYRTLAKERRAVEEADDIEDMLREAEGSW
ncbi:MAG TPA: hypothetical protein VK465_06980 [Fibrobacteria bacterium]|nr:hypothetical protein [Geothrix sp.]HLP41234.1 hypothetical protein [Fibrobacteria bacterium]